MRTHLLHLSEIGILQAIFMPPESSARRAHCAALSQPHCWPRYGALDVLWSKKSTLLTVLSSAAEACCEWPPSSAVLKACARAGQASRGASTSLFTYAMLTAGSPAATTALKATAAARHRLPAAALWRVPMHSPRLATAAAKVAALACQGA